MEQELDVYKVDANNAGNELDRIKIAISEVHEDSGVAADRVGKTAADVLRAQQFILRDSAFLDEVERVLLAEPAGNRQAVPQLVSTGIRTLSVAPSLAPFVKETVRGLKLNT